MHSWAAPVFQFGYYCLAVPNIAGTCLNADDTTVRQGPCFLHHLPRIQGTFILPQRIKEGSRWEVFKVSLEG